jgi:uncharacterized OB-fold protein
MELSAVVDLPGTLSRPRVDRERGVLVGSHCNACGAIAWPSRALCQRCGGLTALDFALPRQGKLLSFAKVWVPRPGLETPYTLGQVELAGAIFFGHVHELRGDARVPLTVRVVIPKDADGSLSFWFEPV